MPKPSDGMGKWKTTQFTMNNIEEGENKTISFQIPELEAPIAAGMINSPAKTDSKGLGTDRNITICKRY